MQQEASPLPSDCSADASVEPPTHVPAAEPPKMRHRGLVAAAANRCVAWVRDYGLDGILVAVSVVLVGTLAFTVSGRITFPYCLEWIEGAMVDHVARVLDGSGLYVEPSISFVPLIYSPLFYWVSAAAATVVGLGYLPLRLVSVAAVVATLVCIVLFVRKEGGRWPAAMAAAALYAGTFRLSGAFFDIGRVDSLSVCLFLWATFFVRFGKGAKSSVAAALLFALCYLTKQSLLAMAGPMALYLLWSDWKRALWFVAVAAGAVVGADLTINTLTDGWYWYYTHSVPQGHLVVWRAAAKYIRTELLAPFALAYAVALWLFVSRQPLGKPNGRVFYALLLAGLLVVVLVSRLHSLSYYNVVMPLHAGIAVIVGVGLRAAQASTRQPGFQLHTERAITAVAIAQLATLLWDPEPDIPSEHDRVEGDAWVAKVAAIPGPVWVTHRGQMGELAGKGRRATMMAMVDIIRSRANYNNAKERLREDVAVALQEQRFERIIIDYRDFWFLRTLKTYYRPDGQRWFSDEDAMMPRVGFRIRPEYGYKPKKW